MINLNCTSTFGNFRWTASASVTDEQAAILANAGLLQILQRSPASKAEKSLAGYEKRPESFERKQIPYSTENADALSEFLGEAVEIAEGVKITPTVKVEEHEIGAASQPKYADEKYAVQFHLDKGDFVEWMASKIDVKTTIEDAFSVENLQAIKAVKIAMIKSL
jgi:hypothetical protein